MWYSTNCNRMKAWLAIVPVLTPVLVVIIYQAAYFQITQLPRPICWSGGPVRNSILLAKSPTGYVFHFSARSHGKKFVMYIFWFSRSCVKLYQDKLYSIYEKCFIIIFVQTGCLRGFFLFFFEFFSWRNQIPDEIYKTEIIRKLSTYFGFSSSY